jgi:glycosyltransferase involved in cell wall biosynthesis
MDRLSVLLCTEGTYPYSGGGVSTWCDILCRELEEVDFSIFAVTGGQEVKLSYELPPNVRGVVQLPLFGTQDPYDHILRAVSARDLERRRARTTPKVVRERFVPMLRRLLGALRDEVGGGEDDGRLLWELWRYFREHDWQRSWRGHEAWSVFLETVAQWPMPDGGAATAADVTESMRWLYSFLVPLAAPVVEVDMVHTTIAGLPGIAGVIAKWERGTPFLVTEHGVWVRERYIAISNARFSAFSKRFLMNLSGYVARVNYSCADVVSPVAEFNTRWEVPWGVERERLVTIPNAVDPSVFAPRPKPAATAGRPTVVAAARVFPLKDILMMIRAAAVARESVPDVQFLVYGSLEADIPYVERCRALIAELGLERTFELAGHHSKPSELFAEGDISALSSISEGFPYTVLESMACGRPVVGTDVGGVREALHGYGIVVAPRDHEAFGHGVVTLLRDDVLRRRLGRHSREAVLARYRTSGNIAAYRALYDRVAGRTDAA